MTTKKNLALTLHLALFAMLVAKPTLAISINFNPAPPLAVNTGDSLSVDIIVSDLSTAGEIVSAFDLTVNYDSALLDVTGGLTFGTSLGDPGLFEVLEDFDIGTLGVIELAALSFLSDDDLAAIQGDSVSLATLNFNAIGNGEASFAFVGGPGKDVKGRDALPILDPGTVPVPEPNTLLLFFLGLCSLMITKWVDRKYAS